MLWEKKLARWVQVMRTQAALPLRLQLWNGQQFDFSTQAPEVTIRLARASALGYLLHPSLDNLGQAYVEGKLDVEGRLQAIFDIANKLAERTLAPASKLGALIPALAHTRKKDAAAISYHYDVSNAFYQAFLDKNMVYSCAYFEADDEDLASAQLKKIDHILTKIRLRRMTDYWISVAAGARWSYGRRKSLVRNVRALPSQKTSMRWHANGWLQPVCLHRSRSCWKTIAMSKAASNASPVSVCSNM
jgi:hypothetical protein